MTPTLVGFTQARSLFGSHWWHRLQWSQWRFQLGNIYVLSTRQFISQYCLSWRKKSAEQIVKTLALSIKKISWMMEDFFIHYPVICFDNLIPERNVFFFVLYSFIISFLVLVSYASFLNFFTNQIILTQSWLPVAVNLSLGLVPKECL